MMKDDKKEHNNKYEKLASFLEDPQDLTNMNEASSDDEVRKLLFMWNECQPAELIRQRFGKRRCNGSGRLKHRKTKVVEDISRLLGDGWRPLRLSSVSAWVRFGSRKRKLRWTNEAVWSRCCWLRSIRAK